MSDQDTSTMIVEIKRDEPKRYVEEPPPQKRRPRPSQEVSWSARRRVMFEESLEPWVLSIQPKESKILYGIWWLYATLKVYKIKWLPEPKSFWSFDRMTAKIAERINKFSHFTRALITVMTAKGGATKTTIASWILAMICFATRLSGIGIDTNRGGGKLAGRYDLVGDKLLTTKSLNKMILSGNVPDYDTLLQLTSSDAHTGALVIHHNAGDHISVPSMHLMATEMKKIVHTTVVDTSPNLREPSTFAAGYVSDVRIIVGKGTSDEDLVDIQETLDSTHYKLRERLDSVLISISALPARKCGARTRYAFAERYGVHPDQVFLIPYDVHLERVKKVRLEALKPRTRYALMSLAEAAGNTARKMRADNKS